MSKHLRADIQAAVAKMSYTGGARKELQKLADHLRDGERVDLIATGSREAGLATGIAVLTNQRLLYLQEGPLLKRSEDFPLEKISSVQWSAGPFFGKITVSVSGSQGVIDNLEKPDGKALCEALRARLTEPRRPPTAEPDVLDQLAKLGQLHKAGVLTDTEFTTKKTELLRRI